MQVILKAMVPRIDEVIRKHSSEGIVRIDLDEDEFERFYYELQVKKDSEISLEHAGRQRPRKGTWIRFKDVTFQCCYSSVPK